ncbi:hypothetical protein [Floridanema evergladense]|uniref:Uncharacterized protein n=1 Tax=Floridaenema evergladense BLCC-F167 TaxID=3153639 RepID=A0ABV4WRP0_9CYAN
MSFSVANSDCSRSKVVVFPHPTTPDSATNGYQPKPGQLVAY